jgi:hypothetical protein
LYLAHKDHAQVPIVYICISQDSRMWSDVIPVSSSNTEGGVLIWGST